MPRVFSPQHPAPLKHHIPDAEPTQAAPAPPSPATLTQPGGQGCSLPSTRVIAANRPPGTHRGSGRCPGDAAAASLRKSLSSSGRAAEPSIRAGAAGPTVRAAGGEVSGDPACAPEDACGPPRSSAPHAAPAAVGPSPDCQLRREAPATPPLGSESGRTASLRKQRQVSSPAPAGSASSPPGSA